MRRCICGYSLGQIGPAEVTDEQIDEARNSGMKIFSKIDAFFYDNDFRLCWENDVIIKGDDFEKKSTNFQCAMHVYHLEGASPLQGAAVTNH